MLLQMVSQGSKIFRQSSHFIQRCSRAFFIGFPLSRDLPVCNKLHISTATLRVIIYRGVQHSQEWTSLRLAGLHAITPTVIIRFILKELETCQCFMTDSSFALESDVDFTPPRQVLGSTTIPPFET